MVSSIGKGHRAKALGREPCLHSVLTLKSQGKALKSHARSPFQT